MTKTMTKMTFDEALERVLQKRIVRYGPRVHKCSACGEERETMRQAMAHFSEQELRIAKEEARLAAMGDRR